MKALWSLAAAGALAWAGGSGDEVKLLPAGPGRDAVAKVCLKCHGATNFRQIRLGRDDWSDRVAEMVVLGAQGTQEELDAVLDYLERNFGTESKVRVNTAPLGELRYVLGFSVEEARAVIAYREEKGDFKEWRDLLKVPAMDAKRIEERKDRMAF
ncbi:MAG: helix-hairpin-helix domain-containing protein [Acidobacteriia bacterium]|nr:helix-hairpin-helix domain-containing protein [Terriglobia bacterium]